MVGGGGAEKKDAARELRARPSSVKPMEAVDDASTLDAQRVLKAALITV